MALARMLPSCYVVIRWNIFKRTIFVFGFEVFTAVVMKSIIFWDVTPCSLLSCHLLTCWFLMKLFLLPWIWRRYVPPKRRLQLNRQHGVTSQKMILFIIFVIVWNFEYVANYVVIIIVVIINTVCSNKNNIVIFFGTVIPTYDRSKDFSF
jgi:hypothetical protein